MAWTSPRTWAALETLPAATLNTHVRDNHTAIYDARCPTGTIAIWHGTIATIPSGWVVCDGNNGTPNLLAKFVKGVATAATNPGATGGSSTHTHNAHTTSTYTFNGAGPNRLIGPTGAHSSVNHEPPWYEVAYIMKTTPAGTWTTPRTWTASEVPTAAHFNTHVRDNTSYLNETKVPASAIKVWHGTLANIPAGWVVCNGSNGTPDLRSKFVKGVPTAATNPGTTGGASGHTHDSHSATTVNNSSTIVDAMATPTTHSSDPTEPPYYEIAYIMKQAAAASPVYTTPLTWVTGQVVTASGLNQQVRDNLGYLFPMRAPTGAIMMWHGTIASIPTGWLICDGNNGTPNLLAKFIKGTAASVDPGATGGTSTHTHDNHVGSGFVLNGALTVLTGPNPHSSVDHEPPFYAVAYLMKS